MIVQYVGRCKYIPTLCTNKRCVKLTQIEKAIEIIQSKPIIRASDLVKENIRRDCLIVLCKRGLIERTARGIYTNTNWQFTENYSLAEVSKRIPKGNICLLSALRFHGLTTQNPSQVWMAIHYKARKPEVDIPYVKIVRFSGTALEYGLEKHEIEGVEVRIYSPAKTVADCFKYRNKIGFDVALEALRDCWHQKKATMDDFYYAAKACGMVEVMRPYLEGLI